MRMSEDPFVENCWYVAAWASDIEEGDKFKRVLLEKPVVIFKGESGRYIALEDRCCHRGAPLALGRIEGDCLRCMYHGMKFDHNGICVEIPGQDKISDVHRVHSYPIEERGGLLWIWMGDPALADQEEILDFPYLSDPEWKGHTERSYLHYDANWMLIVDNLADFSHLAFVHTNTLGGSEDYASESKETVYKLEDGFRMERWHLRSAPAPFHKNVFPNGPDPVDRINDVTIRIPGVMFMETSFGPVGWDPEGDREGVIKYANCQFMTPETRSTTHFFWDYLHNYDSNIEDISASLKESLVAGFMEDKIFIEEQQKYLTQFGRFQPRGLASDRALAHYRNVWNKRLEAERLAYPQNNSPVKNAIL